MHGGGQEGPGLRSGTLSPALCAGFGAAAALASERMHSDLAHVETLWAQALASIKGPWRINGSTEARSEEHTSELQSLMRTSYAVFCLKKKKLSHNIIHYITPATQTIVH